VHDNGGSGIGTGEVMQFVISGIEETLDYRPKCRYNSPGAGVAQSVEQRTENPRVIGSIPIPGTFLLFSPFSFLESTFQSQITDHYGKR
jgi:hypothetical protein